MNCLVILGIVVCVIALAMLIGGIILYNVCYDDGVLIVMGAVWLTVVLPITIVGAVISADEHEKKICDIISLRRESSVDGSFYIGSGHIDSTNYYYYYYVTDRGYRLGKQKTDYTYIIETDKVSPCVYEIKTKGEFKPYYEIYVPYNTIITAFEID